MYFVALAFFAVRPPLFRYVHLKFTKVSYEINVSLITKSYYAQTSQNLELDCSTHNKIHTDKIN